MTPEQMENRLKSHFPDGDVLVLDLTGTHDHYEVRIASTVFKGATRMECQRRVMAAFAEELKTGEVHALTIKTLVKER